jgi:hypothetical protein
MQVMEEMRCRSIWHDLYDRAVLALKNLLIEYTDVFACSDQDLGLLAGVQHPIDTRDAPPIKQLMRWKPLGFEEENGETSDGDAEEQHRQAIVLQLVVSSRCTEEPAHRVH